MIPHVIRLLATFPEQCDADAANLAILAEYDTDLAHVTIRRFAGEYIVQLDGQTLSAAPSLTRAIIGAISARAVALGEGTGETSKPGTPTRAGLADVTGGTVTVDFNPDLELCIVCVDGIDVGCGADEAAALENAFTNIFPECRKPGQS